MNSHSFGGGLVTLATCLFVQLACLGDTLVWATRLFGQLTCLGDSLVFNVILLFSDAVGGYHKFKKV